MATTTSTTATVTTTTTSVADTRPDLDIAEALTILQGCGEPVGYQRITRTEGPRCTAGCLAPGSSPHWHAIHDGWLLIGTTGTVTVNADGMCVRSTMVHPFTGQGA